MSQNKKPVNFKAKYITLGIVVALLVVAIVLCVVFAGNKETKAIMTLETNPGIQLILDADNNVVGQVALNTDGEQLLALVDFNGMSAEAAAKLFAQTANELNKINSNTTSGVASDGATQVNITISAENSANYAKLASNVKKTVNEYFSENGIFAGAVTQLSNDVRAAIERMDVDNLGVSAREYAEMTTQEILEYAKTTSKDLEKIAIDTRAQISTQFDSLYNTVLKIADDAFALADEAFDKAKTALDNAKKDLDAATTQIEKELKQITYDTAKSAYDTAKSAYDKAKATFDEKKAELKKQWDAKVAEFEKNAETYFTNLKTSAKNAYDSAKTTVDARIKAFQDKTAEEKAAVQTSIKAFQESLTSSAA